VVSVFFIFVPDMGRLCGERGKTSFHEKRSFPSLPAPLSPFQEKRKNFFIYFYLPLLGTEPFIFIFFIFFCASRLFWVSLCGAKLDFSVSLAVQARFWWETFVETKVLPPSPLSKEL